MKRERSGRRTVQLRHRVVLSLSAILVAILVTSCDLLLDVEQPSAVTADRLEDPANADLVLRSAIADFECAFGDYIAVGGLIGDELWDGQLGGDNWFYDRRDVTDVGGPYAVSTCADNFPGVYQPLSTARWSADNAIRLVGHDPDMLATANAYAGYARLLLGEAMCSAAIDAGPEITSQEMFALAEEKFTAAMSGGPSDITNMALVGRARARLNQGNTTGALADALQVPAGFVKNATFCTASDRCSNRMWRWNIRGEQMSVEDDFHNLEWKGVPDPRVPVVDQGRPALDRFTPLWTQEKYPLQDSPIPIARYEEAQLIIAEVEGGDVAAGIINALHAAAGLPSFDPNTDGPVADHIVQERQRELFLESHHFYDKTRLNLPFTPLAGTQFQETGSKGGVYGSITCLPLPEVESDNNPNIP